MKKIPDVFLVCLCVFMVAVVAEFIMASIGGVNPWLLVAIVVLSIPAAMAAVWWRNHRDN
ncbi:MULTISPECIES: hypothetical protein [Kocuria]|uniref:hypothetical protein n=1 Tax=Kocuria TaxID=57493 RepID=UPI00065F766F|nr:MULTISPECIES: hypothetical protein [Kocuria]MCT1368089.1 hypothetical protein [Rothia sp. p3-SID1597]RUQ23161.1 hypothetical protein D8M21_00020 [Kocuria sp. HSID16901]